MTNIQMCLSRNMKFHRKRLGLSQAALAEKAETAPNYIALIEVGKSFPSLPMMEKIAAALQIDALDLFDKDGLISIVRFAQRLPVARKFQNAKKIPQNKAAGYFLSITNLTWIALSNALGC